MIKKIIAVLIALFVALTPVSASAIAIPAAIKGALEVIGAVLTVFEFGEFVYNSWNNIVPDLIEQGEFRRQQLLAYWNEIIVQGKLTETNFREYYNYIIEVSGNVAYFTPPVSDEQMYIVNAYAAVLDTSANGLSLDDICAYCFSNGTATDNPDTGFDADGNVTVSGKTFSEICDQLAEQYAPHIQNEYDYLTWQNEVNPNFINQLSFYNKDTGFPNGWTECYLIPFYRDANGQDWYGGAQSHFCIVDGKWVYEVKNMFSSESSFTAYNSSLNGMSYSTYPYLILHTYVTGTYADSGYGGSGRRYGSYSQFLTGSFSEGGGFFLRDFDDGLRYYKDVYTSLDVSEFRDQFTSKPTGEEIIDIGFMIYNEPMVLDGYIDPIPVADDDVVTLTGDTIYDYSITNTEGDTTTINNYITNNYVIPDTPDDDTGNGEGGSSSAAGDITVSGNVGVGGQIDVNVNVSSDSSDDFLLPADQYAEYLPEVAPGVADWLSSVYSFLPPEVVALLIGGIGAAILCRILGR